MGSSGIKNSTNQLNADAGLQRDQASQLSTQGQTLINQGQADQSPLRDFLHSVINGNSVTTNQAIAPAIKNIATSTNANREAIYGHTAPGAARDVLLGENQRSQGDQVAGVTNSTWLQAFPALAQLAAGNTSAGLGLTGAGITSLGNSVGTTGSVLNAQEQQKANTVNAFGSLAGAAGTAAGGFLGGNAFANMLKH